MQSRLALVLLCLLPACNVKCTTRGFDARGDVEKLIRQMAETVDTVQSVSCPEIKRAVGTQAECKVVFQDGTEHPVDVKLTDKNGGTFHANWKKPPLGAKGRAEMAELASKRAGVEVTIRCNDDKVVGLAPGDVMRCTLETAKDGSSNVLVYFKPDSGWTFRLENLNGGIQGLTDAVLTQTAEATAEKLGKILGDVTSTECDRIVGAKAGASVSCTVHFSSGAAHEATGDVRSESEGDLSVWLNWTRHLISERVVEKVAPILDKRVGEKVTTRCPITGIQEIPAEGIPCTVTLKDGSAKGVRLVQTGDELRWSPFE